MKYLYQPAVIAATLLLSLSACRSGQSAGPFGAPEDMGSEEDANARQTYEWTMLHDPATGQIPAHIREKELAFAATLPDDGSFGYAKGTSVDWQSRGPWNVGGRTRAFAIDVSNVNHLVAGSTSGGMYRSLDGGLTWTATTPANEYLSVSCLAQDTRAGHTAVWYYGTGESYGNSASATGAAYHGNGIYKSVDGGLSWSVLPSTTTANITSFDTWSDYIWNIVTDPASQNQDVVYAAAYGGIYRSADGGGTWTLVLGNFNGATRSFFTDVAISATGVVYATLSSEGPHRGLFRSTDGVNFTDITPAGFPIGYQRVKIGISPANENQVYFLGNTPGYGHLFVNYNGGQDWNSLWKYTYLSGDGSGAGGAWADRSLNLPTGSGPFDGFNSQGSYDLVVKVKPTDTNTVFVGGTNLYRSTSGFADTTHTTQIGGYLQGATLPVVANYANHHPDQHELAFTPGNPDNMISTNDGGIFRTTDNTAAAISWTPLNNGYITTMFYTCAIDHAATNDIIIGGAQDNGSWFTASSVLSNPWVTPRGGDGSYCAIADNSAAYYFSIQNGKMMRAKLNAAGGVDSFARIDPIGASGFLFINPYVLDPNNNNLMYLIAGKVLWRNNNLAGIPYASNWDSISTNWVRFPDSLTANQYSAIAVSRTPANRVYVGTSSRQVYRIDNANTGTPTPVLISPTSGATVFPPGGYVSSIAVDPANADHVMVSFSNYGLYSLFYSSDGGGTWTKCAGNLEANVNGTGNGPSIRWASILPVNGGTVYLVGTSVGLFATSQLNGTATEWIRQGVNTIGSSIVDMIDCRTTDGLVAVATHSHGMFSAKITGPDVTNGVHAAPPPSAFGFTAAPNPFADGTALRFSLSRRTNVGLQVFDELGRPVRTLANAAMEAGTYQYRFEGAYLPPGIYYATLNAGGQRETRKLMLVR